MRSMTTSSTRRRVLCVDDLELITYCEEGATPDRDFIAAGQLASWWRQLLWQHALVAKLVFAEISALYNQAA